MVNKKHIPGIPKPYQNYLLSLLYHLCLPLLPLLIEFWITKKTQDTSLMLVSSLYAVSVGATSRNKLLFGLSVVISIVFAIAFGITTGGAVKLTYCREFAYISLISIFFVHAAERWNIHVVDEIPYWEFS